MKHRLAILFCLVMLFSLVPYVPVARGQVYVFFPSLNIGLGFGPSNVQPVFEGVPIYTQGDNVWVESYSNATLQVELSPPSGLGGSSLKDLGPGQLLQLYTFGQNDSAGTWTLSVASSSLPSGSTDIPISVLSPDSSLVPTFQGDNLTGNRLNQVFAIPPTQAYDIQACSTGTSSGSTASFGLAGIANGTLGVSLKPSAAQFSFSQLPSGLAAWIELYSQYSYSVGNETTSQALLAANTPAFTFSSNTFSNLTYSFNQQMHLRPGRFDLRVFMRTNSGLSVREAEFLRNRDGSWLYLGVCTSLVSVSSPTFTLTTNLDSSNSSWPRHLVTMYAINGEEAYSVSDVTTSAAVIHLKASSGNGPLTGVTITASAPGLQPRQWDTFDSAVYLMLSRYPSNVSVALSFSGVASRTLSTSILNSYSSKSLSFQAGTLDGSATLNRAPLANATFSLTATGSAPITIPQGGKGNFSILLPPDNYTLTASYQGNSVSEEFSVSANVVTKISLELSRPSFPALLYVLAIVGVAGMVANVIVWRRYIERRRIYD